MKRGIASWALAGALVATAFLADRAEAADPVDVKLIGLQEVRSVDLPALDKKTREVLAKTGGLIDRPNALAVRLELVGKPIENAFGAGKVKLTSAKLDKARPLTPAAPEISSGAFEDYLPILRQPDIEGVPPQPKDKAGLPLVFALPPRDAKTIASLEGTIKVIGGKSEEVKFPGIAKMSGKLANKTLETAGLTITFVKPPENAGFKPGQALAFEVTGGVEQILDILLTNPQGEDLQAGFNVDRQAKNTTFVLYIEEKIPADAVLRMTVVPKPEILDVPFKFSNIKLP